MHKQTKKYAYQIYLPNGIHRIEPPSLHVVGRNKRLYNALTIPQHDGWSSTMIDVILHIFLCINYHIFTLIYGFLGVYVFTWYCTSVRGQ